MKDDISIQVLSQTSDSIQKLFDLSTRIDERAKAIVIKQTDLQIRLENLIIAHTDAVQRLAVVESKLQIPIHEEMIAFGKSFNEVDKRLAAVEHSSKGNESRWNSMFQFVIQLVWIVLAAYVLFKLNLNPPPVP
jgi:hypothetical protein